MIMSRNSDIQSNSILSKEENEKRKLMKWFTQKNKNI